MGDESQDDIDHYEHPDHGEMEWRSVDSDVVEDGWRCSRCGTMAPPDDADEVFDSHDCDRYKNLTEKITGSIDENTRTLDTGGDRDAE